MSQPVDPVAAAPLSDVLAIMRALESDGAATDVAANWLSPQMLDITFRIGEEGMLVMVAAGDHEVRIVGRRREYELPVEDLDGVLRNWPSFRRGWHS